MSKLLIFRNDTQYPFEYKYGGEVYRFEAQEERMMDGAIAMHFAKHLAYREITRDSVGQTLVFSTEKMKEYMSRYTAAKPVEVKAADVVAEKEEVNKELATGKKYADMKKSELVELANELGLENEGTKKDLIERLEESDFAGYGDASETTD